MSSSISTFSSFERGAPAFVGAELDRLYGARYSSLRHFRVTGEASEASTYVARVGEDVTTVFMYVRRGGAVRVLNEGIRIPSAEAASFARQLFARDPGVGAVQLHCIDTDATAATLGLPCQRLDYAEDTVLMLPANAALYLSSLGSSTRATVKNRLNKLKREFPSFTFAVTETGAVSEADVRAIMALSRLRMASKDKTSTIDASEEERVVQAVRECGYVTTVRISGELCAGAILYRHGSNFSARVLAHAAQYDDYRLGFVCAFLTISGCAALPDSGCFYFGWGRYEYKYHLGGRRRALSTLLIYRSRWQAVRHARLAWSTRYGGLAFRTRARLLRVAAIWKSLAASVKILTTRLQGRA